MKIYFATTQSTPFFNDSNLAEFSYCMTRELYKKGHDVRVVMPLYSNIYKEYKNMIKFEKSFYISTTLGDEYVGIYSCENEGVIYYFIDNEYYFRRNKISGFVDDGKRFSYFSRALLEVLEEVDFYPDIIHLNDYQTSIAAVLFKDSYIQRKKFYDTKVILTIHSLKEQGIYNKILLSENLGLSRSYFTHDKLEDDGNINFLKGGIVFSDLVTSVSRTYANEIRNDINADNIQNVLIDNAKKIFGIENGINYDVFNPKYDDDIFIKYDLDSIHLKKENKIELQKMLGLKVDENIPLISYMGDLESGKGLGSLSFIFDELMEEDVEFVLLGTGSSDYENDFLHFSYKYRNKVSVNIFRSDVVSKKIFAASDIVLKPSRFEPCGRSHLIAMRYGAIPIVRNAGGLKDSVKQYLRKDNSGNGFLFENYIAHELLFAIKDALFYFKDKSKWNSIIRNAMIRNSSWLRTTEEYEKIYRKILEEVK